jgi:hypothetical protein
VRGIELLFCHFEGAFEESVGFGVLFLEFTVDAVGEVDDPVDGVVVGHAGEDLDCVAQLVFCGLDLVDHHEIFGVVAVADSVEDVVLAHL